MKKVPCTYSKCGLRRVHYTKPDIQRGAQYIEVPEDFQGQAFCSITCKMMHDGYNKIKETEDATQSC